MNLPLIFAALFCCAIVLVTLFMLYEVGSPASCEREAREARRQLAEERQRQRGEAAKRA